MESLPVSKFEVLDFIDSVNSKKYKEEFYHVYVQNEHFYQSLISQLNGVIKKQETELLIQKQSEQFWKNEYFSLLKKLKTE
jgi:hypothetical protein